MSVEYEEKAKNDHVLCIQNSQGNGYIKYFLGKLCGSRSPWSKIFRFRFHLSPPKAGKHLWRNPEPADIYCSGIKTVARSFFVLYSKCSITLFTTITMNAILTVFGRGQVTLPKKMRDKFKTRHYIAQDTKDGILIRPLYMEQQVHFKEGKGEISLSFTPPVDAETLLTDLRKANGAL